MWIAKQSWVDWGDGKHSPWLRGMGAKGNRVSGLGFFVGGLGGSLFCYTFLF